MLKEKVNLSIIIVTKNVTMVCSKFIDLVVNVSCCVLLSVIVSQAS